MYCPNCGNRADLGARFCGKCGKPIVEHNVHEGTKPPPAMVKPPAQEPAEKPKASAGLSRGKAVFFWLMWLALASLCWMLAVSTYSLPQIGVFAVLLTSLVLLRNRLFRKAIPTLLLWAVAYILVFTVASTLAVGNVERDREIAEIQSAFEQKDLPAITGYLHPENQGFLAQVFTEHQQELDKVGKLMSTRRLIYSDKHYCEYEVQDGDNKYVMIFEKVGGKWRLSRF